MVQMARSDRGAAAPSPPVRRGAGAALVAHCAHLVGHAWSVGAGANCARTARRRTLVTRPGNCCLGRLPIGFARYGVAACRQLRNAFLIPRAQFPVRYGSNAFCRPAWPGCCVRDASRKTGERFGLDLVLLIVLPACDHSRIASSRKNSTSIQASRCSAISSAVQQAHPGGRVPAQSLPVYSSLASWLARAKKTRSCH